MKIYRRSLGARALSLGSLALFSLLEFAHLRSGGPFLSFGGLLLAGLGALCLVASLLNLGDRYGIDETGVRYANPLLSQLGLLLDRSVAWKDIRSIKAYRGIRFGVREDRPSALFLEIANGRRFVIDSVEDLEEIHGAITRHLQARDSDPPASLREEGR